MTTRPRLPRAPLSNMSTTPPLHWTSWSVTLQELQCLTLPDGVGRKPYIWPVLVWFDDFTKTTPVRVGITGPIMRDVSVPLSEDMHVGDIVAIPATVGNVGTYIFEDSGITDTVANSLGHNLLLFVALFEHHDFGEYVIAAGYTVFQSALQEAIATNLRDLVFAINSSIASGNNDPTTDPNVIDIEDGIKDTVNGAIVSAFNNALPDHSEVVLAFASGLKPDDFIDSNNAQFHEVKTTSDINLQFEHSTKDRQNPDLTLITKYAVLGQLQVGTPAASLGLPFDCASGGPYPAIYQVYSQAFN